MLGDDRARNPTPNPAASTSTSTGVRGSGKSMKIERWHLERVAVIDVRQSTLAQVREHAESAARQYALAEQAVARA